MRALFQCPEFLLVHYYLFKVTPVCVTSSRYNCTENFAVFKVCHLSSIHVVDDVGLLEKLLVLHEVALPVEPPIVLGGWLVQGVLR